MNVASKAISCCLTIAAVVAPACVSATPLDRSLVAGERFVYARDVVYRTSIGLQTERAKIRLIVVSVTGTEARVLQRISIDGGPETTREIAASSSGSWIYPDRNSLAQNFAGWDRNQLGLKPARVEPGRSWPVVVPRSAMFVAGKARVRITSSNAHDVTVQSTGTADPVNGFVPQRGARRSVHTSVSGTWEATSDYHDGIVMRYARTDHIRYVVDRNIKTVGTMHVTVSLIEHSQG